MESFQARRGSLRACKDSTKPEGTEITGMHDRQTLILFLNCLNVDKLNLKFMMIMTSLRIHCDIIAEFLTLPIPLRRYFTCNIVHDINSSN